ncbi:MAG TPA: carboxymuconolactone decarboxylase family protein [Gemmataceae bacterium]|nr:carboxymuconolactone decarboxylase family protein [Gemmataceae bacterium]
MEQSLILLLLDQKTGTGGVPLPVASDAEAWKCLPRADKGAGQPLPAWARVLARALPRTTAAMLELDYLQRTRSPLDPKLRARMRWVAAHANRCAYSEAYAAADLRRAGVDDAGIRALARGDAKLPRPEEVALEFARKMTVAANTVTDAEVGQLVRLYGQKQVVAMVLLLAYANFQDRFILSLNVPLETGGPLKPLEVRFARKEAGRQQAAAPKRRPPAGKTIFSTKPAADREWTSLDFAQLQKAIEEQRARQPRIAVPSWEDVRKHLPPGYPKDRPLRIRWSLVCLGYQPELAAGWSACMRAFGQESRQDRAFEESVFWVITRSLQCFY